MATWGAVALLALGPRAGLAADACVNEGGSGGCFDSIQAAVNDAGVGTGDTVTVNGGLYRELVVIPPGKDGLVLLGKKNPQLDAGPPQVGPGIHVMSNAVVIEGLTILHARDPDGHGILAQVGAVGVSGLTVRRSTLVGAENHCIQLAPGSDGAVFDQVTFMGCEDDGIRGEDPTTGTRVERCQFSRNGDWGVAIDGDGSVVSNNQFSQIGNWAISLDGDGVTVASNRIEYGDNYGIRVQGDQFRITGNQIADLSNRGLSLDCVACTGGLVANNKISTTEGSISLDADGAGVVVENNQASVADGDGLSLSGVGITARGNKLKAIGTGPGDHCIEVSGSDHLIQENTVDGCAGSGVRVEGTGHRVSDNRVKRALRHGIDVRDAGPSDAVQVTANQVKKVTGIGIVVRQNVTNTVVSQNKVGGSLKADYCDAGTGTTSPSGQFGTEISPVAGECPVVGF